MTAAESSSLSMWSGLFLLGFVLVWLGVILEGVEILVRRRHARQRKRSATEPWYDSPRELKIPRWAHRIGDFGWLILVVGLALEEAGHSRVTKIKDGEIGRLTTQLNGTTKLAGEATERAAIWQSNSVALQLQVEQLRATNLWQLEEARKDLLPRIFKGQGVARSMLSGWPRTIKALVVSRFGDSECRDVAGQIKYVLSISGWNVQGSNSVPIPYPARGWTEWDEGESIDTPDPANFPLRTSMWMRFSDLNGVKVLVSDKQPASQDVTDSTKFLVSALNRSGILTVLEPSTLLNESNFVVVLVGHKPVGDARRELEKTVRQSQRQTNQ